MLNFLALQIHNQSKVFNYKSFDLLDVWQRTIHFLLEENIIQDFPDSIVGKESACNAGDPGLIPGSEDPLKKG